jgi:hypothetical protein
MRMPLPRRPPDSDAPVTDRRSWLAGALAGAACAAFVKPAHAGSETALAPKAGASTSKNPTLAPLLDRNHGLSPEFRGGLSNHVSMGLYSLSAIGANNAQIQRFAEVHWPRLEPLPSAPGPAISAENWRAYRGKSDAINGYRALFTAAVARDGRDATLRKYLPDLLPGIGAAAFHPLIRTAYGVRFGDDREVADGLAYWAIAYRPLGLLGRAGAERDPRALLASVHATPALVVREPSGGLIGGKMKSAAELPEFRAKVDALAPSDTTLAALAAATVRLYTDGGDFILLHAVTGTHAYRLLQPFIQPSELGLRYFWQAILAAYVSTGAPSVVDPPAGNVPAWNESLERARASVDEHDIKLVDVAHEEGAFYADPILYRRAAARRMKLIERG